MIAHMPLPIFVTGMILLMFVPFLSMFAVEAYKLGQLRRPLIRFWVTLLAFIVVAPVALIAIAMGAETVPEFDGGSAVLVARLSIITFAAVLWQALWALVKGISESGGRQ